MEDLTPLVGTEVGESLIGTELDDGIDGLGGDDSLGGGTGGSDTLTGGEGNDTFIAGSSGEFDIFDGGVGIDTIVFNRPYSDLQPQIYVPQDTGRFNPDGDRHLSLDRYRYNIVSNVEFAQFEDGIIPLDYQLTIDEDPDSRNINISRASSDNPSVLNTPSGTITVESIPVGSIDIASYPYRQEVPSSETDFSDEYFPIATFTVSNTTTESHVLGSVTPTVYNDDLEFTLDSGDKTYHLRPRYGGFGNNLRYNARYDGGEGGEDIFNIHKGGGSVRIEEFDPETGGLLDPHTRLSFFNAGTLEGEPREISPEDEQTLLAQRGWTGFNIPEGETRTFTQYARITGTNPLYGVPFTSTTEVPTAPAILSISEDTGVDGDYRTSDNTLEINGISDIGATIEVFLNGNSIGTTVTGSDGKWTLDHTHVELADGNYQIIAVAENAAGVSPGSVSREIEIDTDYDIELDFSHPSIANRTDLQNIITTQAQSWEDIILNDLPDVANPNSSGDIIDDIKITFRVADIDRAGGTLASAGGSENGLRDPLTGQATAYLPFEAVITLDVNDIQAFTTPHGRQTLRHELGHALGFNSKTFEKKNLVKEIAISNSPDVTIFGFTGQNALDEYHARGGSLSHSSVPLEEDDDDTPAHWHEWVFPDITELGRTDDLRFAYPDDSLMSVSTPENQNAVLTTVTLGAFQDLGFDVDFSEGSDLTVYSSSNVPFVHTSPLVARNY